MVLFILACWTMQGCNEKQIYEREQSETPETESTVIWCSDEPQQPRQRRRNDKCTAHQPGLLEFEEIEIV